MFEHKVCLKQFKWMEEKAYEKGEDVLVFRGEEDKKEVKGKKCDQFEIKNGDSVLAFEGGQEGDSTFVQMEVEGGLYHYLS